MLEFPYLFILVDVMSEESFSPAWVEVSLLVDQELAEPVASAIGEVIPAGVVIERAYDHLTPGGKDEIVGPVRVYGYLPADDLLEERRQRISRAIFFLSKISPLPDPSYTPLEVEDWTTAWRKHYRPIPLGSKLIVVPSWLKNPDPERRAVYLDPGQAFGSGSHPSTQLCLILIEEHLGEHAVQYMLDIGCGSGILSIAAVKLGVDFALGVDKDPLSVEVARENAQKNQVSDKTRFAAGSVRELLRGEIQPGQAPLTAVNMIAPHLEDLLKRGLPEVISPGGTLILSGILEDQITPLLKMIYDREMRITARRQQGDWVGLQVLRPG